jgi:flagellin
MAAVLGTNVASLWASKNLQSAQTNMANSVERLSSGLRINRARDDAAGLGIANALSQQINSAQMGMRNLNDGISIVQTAEGALSQASEMAQKILALAIQGTNAALSENQKQSLKTEMDSLLTGINGIKARTKFGDTTLLSGSAISVFNGNVSSDSVTISAAGLYDISTASSLGPNGATLSASVSALANNYSAALAQSVATAAASYINGLSTQRGVLGAIQNQMEYSVNNITELSANLTSARSRIIDTDYASETASLTKGQILQQAATAMLAQANQMPNVILSLLK